MGAKRRRKAPAAASGAGTPPERLIEVRSGEAALRDLRAAVMQLSYALVARPGAEGFLVLDRPGITQERLAHEWRLASEVLRPAILSRLKLCVSDAARVESFPAALDTAARDAIAERLSQRPPALVTPASRGSSWFVVTKVLASLWLTNSGPVTTERLQRITGFSYPTVAKVLQDLGPWATRASDRRVALRSLARELVLRLVHESSNGRRSFRYVNRTPKRRSPESLLSALEQLAVPGLALGGVLGALHHAPDLDIVGVPRLDLALAAVPHPDTSFVHGLAPEFLQTDDPREPADLVVHVVPHADPLFVRANDGWCIAEPVDCMLDLHEAHLEAQAAALVQTLTAQREDRS